MDNKNRELENEEDSVSDSDLESVLNLGDENDDDRSERWRLVAKIMKRSFPYANEPSEQEKKFMDLWNQHVFIHNLKMKKQILQACHSFVELQGKRIVKKNLYRHFVLHLLNLFDFNLLESKDIAILIQRLQEIGRMAEKAKKES